MHGRTENTERPNPRRWTAVFLHPLRGLIGALAIGLTLFFALELVAWHVYPARSSRFLVGGVSGGQPAWIDNQFFPYRFFSARLTQPPLPVVALKNPPPGTLRVCLLGGSQAVGAPDPEFGLGHQLELLLRHRYPGQPVEVVNLAIAGGNSHVLREIARDLDRLCPNAIVVLTGNEEVAGPYGPASGFGRFNHSARLARGLTLFSRTRLSQMLMAGINHLFPARTDLDAWRSREPITLKGRMASDDPRLKTVTRSFRRNYTAMLQAAARSAPVVIACTVPVNLRDCAPFSTSFLEDETAAQQVREMLRAAVAAEMATNATEAARLYADIIRRHPTHAEALFRAARLALRDNHTAEAAALFSRARDADALRLRADSGINALIRSCAVETSVSLLDAENLFALRSPQGIPGREFFYDHVHFTFEGTHLLASALLDRLEFLRAFDPEPGGTVPSPEVLADEMLYHPWGRAARLRTVIDQHLHPPFRRQLDNAGTVARLTEEQKLWQSRADAITPENARAIFSRHQTSSPDDAWLAVCAADNLLAANAPELAEKAALAAYARWPHRFDVRARLAVIRAQQGQNAEAGIAFIRGEPGADVGYYDISQAIAVGQALLARGKNTRARPWFEYAGRRDPWNSEAAIALAETLHRLEDNDAAIQVLQTAIQRTPRNPLLWDELASLYGLAGDWNMASRCLQKSEAIAPYRYERLLKWASTLVRIKQYARARRPIRQYLAVMPDDPEAVELLAQIMRARPPHAEPPAEPLPDKSTLRKFPWE